MKSTSYNIAHTQPMDKPLQIHAQLTKLEPLQGSIMPNYIKLKIAPEATPTEE
jgi:hypothetical protein